MLKRPLLPLSLAGLFAMSAPAVAQPPRVSPAAEPSAAALELAELLKPASFAMLWRISDEEAAILLEQQLLRNHYAPRGARCVSENPACAAAAKEVARKYGPLQARFSARIISEAHARLFDATLSPADIAASTAFLRTPSGAKFRDSLQLLTPGARPKDAAVMNRIIEDSLAGETGSPTAGMYDEFYDRTEGLPRAKEHFPLPPAHPATSPR